MLILGFNNNELFCYDIKNNGYVKTHEHIIECISYCTFPFSQSMIDFICKYCKKNGKKFYGNVTEFRITHSKFVKTSSFIALYKTHQQTVDNFVISKGIQIKNDVSDFKGNITDWIEIYDKIITINDDKVEPMNWRYFLLHFNKKYNSDLLRSYRYKSRVIAKYLKDILLINYDTDIRYGQIFTVNEWLNLRTVKTITHNLIKFTGKSL